MNFVFSALFFFAALAHGAEVMEEEGVLVLTTDNFKKVITENSFVLVDFYAPWCRGCLALDDVFAETAIFLGENDWPVKLGKVDTTVEVALAREYRIRSYPTVKFFRSGTPIEYTGSHEINDIISWLLKNASPSVVHLDSVDMMEEFLKANEIAIVGFFTNLRSDEAEMYTAAANESHSFPFGITKDADVISKYGAMDGGVLLFKPFEEKVSRFEGEITLNALKKFIEVESMPLIVEFKRKYADQISHSSLNAHLLFFLSKEAGHYEKYIYPLKEVAKQYRGDILFVTLSSENADHRHVFRLMNISQKELPTLRLISMDENEDTLAYKSESNDLSEKPFIEFLKRFRDGKLVPDDWDKKPVKVLVSMNFDDVVFDTTKDVLVLFFAPWCVQCKKFAPIYEMLGEEYKNNDSIVIAKIDWTANELEHTKITSFPTIKLYRKEDNKVTDFTLDMRLENFVKFLDAGGAIEVNSVAGSKNEKDEL